MAHYWGSDAFNQLVQVARRNSVPQWSLMLLQVPKEDSYFWFTVIPAVLAPSLGPVIGGPAFSVSLLEWFLTILSSVAAVLVLLFFPKTWRRIGGDGSLTPLPKYRSVWQSIQLRRKKRTRRPNALVQIMTNSSSASIPGNNFKFKPPNILRSLFLLFEEETSLLLWTSSLVFAGYYYIATVMPSIFSKRYGYSVIQIGLVYLSLAFGSIGAASIVRPAINWNYKCHCAHSGVPYDRSRQKDLSTFPVEKVCLEIGLPLAVPRTDELDRLIGWGWAMHAVAHGPCRA
ncbi:hypothetical protein ED733_008956 [Metarhizium rileyi]|uniref:Major facilitator superfamily domain, general substrate transporter n=1 Tax=Metarhizium rileyi (strain RCEF 4871) TaxID=1649241 RepID=A0A5C6GM19_METRR|nr:hypothetical protein ED733_008956 [Metarhizium rileyi]